MNHIRPMDGRGERQQWTTHLHQHLRLSRKCNSNSLLGLWYRSFLTNFGVTSHLVSKYRIYEGVEVQMLFFLSLSCSSVWEVGKLSFLIIQHRIAPNEKKGSLYKRTRIFYYQSTKSKQNLIKFKDWETQL